jgi:hypothetical protein
VRAFVQGHWPVWVGFGEGEGGVVCCLEVAHALETGVSHARFRQASMKVCRW